MGAQRSFPPPAPYQKNTKITAIGRILKGGSSMDFKDAKQRKTRGLSVKQVTDKLNENSGEYETLIVIGMEENGGLDFWFSGDNDADMIGQLEVAKNILVEQIRER